MKFIKLLIVTLLVVINCCSCGKRSAENLSSKLTLKEDLKVTCSLESMFLTTMSKISNGKNRSSKVVVKKNGKILYPMGKGPLPKNIQKALNPSEEFTTIPKGTNIDKLVKIINKQFGVNGKMIDNNFVIDVK